MWESVGVEVWELRETIEWGTLQTTTDLLWHVAHPWIVTPWKYHPHPPDRVLNWLCEVHLWSEHLAVMAGQPFCSSGMSQDLMSHLDLGTPPPLKVSRGHMGNTQYTHMGGGWTSHHSCLSTASGFMVWPIKIPWNFPDSKFSLLFFFLQEEPYLWRNMVTFQQQGSISLASKSWSSSQVSTMVWNNSSTKLLLGQIVFTSQSKISLVAKTKVGNIFWWQGCLSASKLMLSSQYLKWVDLPLQFISAVITNGCHILSSSSLAMHLCFYHKQV